MLNTPQTVTLKAFLTALIKLDSPLPAKLQEEINKVGKLFTNTPTDAMNQLLELAKHDSINELYLQARLDIQQQYEIQERNKFDKASQQNQPTATPAERLENIALPILQAADSKAEAEKHKSAIVPTSLNP
jgi:hypothetical protein